MHGLHDSIISLISKHYYRQAMAHLLNANLHPRPLLDNQKSVGGDMSICLIARLPLPTRFASPEEQQFKGLNFETVVTVQFPPPAWLNNSEYTVLRPGHDDDNANSALFSLNLSIYGQSSELHEHDWNDMDFLLYGIIHPYALTWEVADSNSDDGDAIQHYTIPSLVVRDHCYQPSVP